MVPLDYRSYTISSQSATVRTALSCTIFETIDTEEYCDLKV